MLWTLLAALLTTPAYAECDADALAERVNDASPVAMAEAFIDLAQCDQDKAKKLAATAIPKVLGGATAPQAMVEALRVAEPALVRTWLQAQEPDVRSRSIAKIGKLCAANPEVADFFADAHADIGVAFWEERWHRGLSDCRYPRVQALLAEALEGAAVGRGSRNRSGYFALLEVYARNLRADAVPLLASYLASPTDTEEAVQLVGMFGHAANVGGSEGLDKQAVTASLAAIEQAAPTLAYEALHRAETTLLSVGKPKKAALLARHAWADRYLEGSYTYGVTAIEDVTCKNGSRRAVLHVATFTEPGEMWPHTLQDGLEARLKAEWALDAAVKCKGTSVVHFMMSDAPLDAKGRDTWTKVSTEAFEVRFSEAKMWVVAEEGFGY